MTSDDTTKEPDNGVMCPKCECRHVPVINSRPSYKKRIRRRRECRYCKYRFTTYEETPDPPPK